MPRPSDPSGYTLTELILLLALFALLSALAVPSFSNVLARDRTRAILDRLSGDLYLARSVAVRRAQPITIRFDPPTGCAARYELVDVGGEVLRRVTTDPGDTGVCLESNVDRAMRVNARGLLVGSPRTIRASRGEVADSVTISMVGRVYRW